eukprot:IDg9164t1
MSAILGSGVWKSASRKARAGRGWRTERDGLYGPGSVVTQHSSSVELAHVEPDKVIALKGVPTGSTGLLDLRSVIVGELKADVIDMGVQISRAPSLELGDAPSSPGGGYGRKRADSSLSSRHSSRHSSADDWSGEASRLKSTDVPTLNVGRVDRIEPDRVRRKPAMVPKMFGGELAECQDIPPSGERPNSRGGSGSLRLRIFGARMLSNLGPKWKNRTPVPS